MGVSRSKATRCGGLEELLSGQSILWMIFGLKSLLRFSRKILIYIFFRILLKGGSGKKGVGRSQIQGFEKGAGKGKKKHTQKRMVNLQAWITRVEHVSLHTWIQLLGACAPLYSALCKCIKRFLCASFLKQYSSPPFYSFVSPFLVVTTILYYESWDMSDDPGLLITQTINKRKTNLY